MYCYLYFLLQHIVFIRFMHSILLYCSNMVNLISPDLGQNKLNTMHFISNFCSSPHMVCTKTIPTCIIVSLVQMHFVSFRYFILFWNEGIYFP